jgi:hypothetical protein
MATARRLPVALAGHCGRTRDSLASPGRNHAPLVENIFDLIHDTAVLLTVGFQIGEFFK